MRRITLLCQHVVERRQTLGAPTDVAMSAPRARAVPAVRAGDPCDAVFRAGVRRVLSRAELMRANADPTFLAGSLDCMDACAAP